MKFVQISVYFEYSDVIEAMLDKHQVNDYIRYNMVDGKDPEGKHFGSQVFPGNFTVYHAQVSSDHLDALFADMEAFQTSRPAHHHMQAIVLPIERSLRSSALSE